MAKNEMDNVVIFEGNRTSYKVRPSTVIRRFFIRVLVGLCVLVIVYFATPLSRLGHVYFEGLTTLRRSEVLYLMDAPSDALFVTLRLAEMERNIQVHPMVEEVRIQRRGINGLTVSLVEYLIGACAVIAGEMYHVLTDGRALHEREGLRGNCDQFVITGLTEYEIETDVLGFFVRQLSLVDSGVVDLIQMVEHQPKFGDIHRFSLYLIDGNTIKVSSYTMRERLSLYLEMLYTLPAGQTGILNLDVGMFFEPH